MRGVTYPLPGSPIPSSHLTRWGRCCCRDRGGGGQGGGVDSLPLQ